MEVSRPRRTQRCRYGLDRGRGRGRGRLPPLRRERRLSLRQGRRHLDRTRTTRTMVGGSIIRTAGRTRHRRRVVLDLLRPRVPRVRFPRRPLHWMGSPPPKTTATTTTKIPILLTLPLPRPVIQVTTPVPLPSPPPPFPRPIPRPGPGPGPGPPHPPHPRIPIAPHWRPSPVRSWWIRPPRVQTSTS